MTLPTRSPAGGKRSLHRQVATIYSSAFRLHRAHWRTLLLAGLIVFIPASILEALVEFASERKSNSLPLGGVAIALVVAATNTLAYQMYKGVATHASVLWRQGGRHVPIGDVFRNLAYMQLIVVDVVVTLATGIGFLALVLPGIAIGTYLSVAPVIVELDKCNARTALVRSFHLVKKCFWLALVVQVSVVLAVYAIETALQALGGVVLPGPSGIGDALLVGAVAAFASSMLVKPISALAVIELMHELLANERRLVASERA